MLPQASAGPSFQLAMLSGKFHGTISPTTPSGSRNVDVDAAGDGDRLAVVLVDRAGVEVEDLRDHADLAARAGDRLADVLATRSARAPRRAPRRASRAGAAAGARSAGRDRAPGRERRLRAGDGGVGLLDPGLLELGDRLLGRRVEDRERHPRSNRRSRS